MKVMMPMLIIFAGAFVTFWASKIKGNKGFIGSLLSSIVLITCISSFVPLLNDLRNHLILIYPTRLTVFSSFIAFDYSGILISLTALILGLLVAVFSFRYMEHDLSQDKFYPILLLMIGSIIGISSARDVFTLWVFFELMCLSSYILVAFRKDTWEPLEAGFKYIIMSASGSMLVLFGIALLFGSTGSVNFFAIKHAVMGTQSLCLTAAVILFIAGFGVKAAIVPFHTWLPDAHSQAPSGISAMLSGIVIEAGLFAMIRILVLLTALPVDTGMILIILGVASMFVGNLMALPQKHIKRMLAYSSVAQVGFIVLGIGIGMHYLSPIGFSGGFFHIITHAGMKGLAFLVAGIIIHYTGTARMDEMNGLAKKMPVISLCFAIACLGLAGVPPLSGFMSKWIIYEAGVSVGGYGYLLAAIAIFNSILSLGYYLPAINRLYSSNESANVTGSRRVPFSVALPVVLLALSIIYLGLFPSTALVLVNGAAKEFMYIIGAAI